LFQLLDVVNVDDNREYIEFRFRDFAGEHARTLAQNLLAGSEEISDGTDRSLN
jgi:hypothetical protein